MMWSFYAKIVLKMTAMLRHCKFKIFYLEIFKRIFSENRLSKLRKPATIALQKITFDHWSAYAHDVSKQALIEILNYRDRKHVSDNQNRKMDEPCFYHFF